MGKLIKALFLIGIGVCIGRSSVATTEVVKTDTEIVETIKPEKQENDTKSESMFEGLEVEEVSEEKDLKLGHKNASKTAKDFTESYPRSRSTTYETLIKKGFSEDEALYAVDDSGINWGEVCHNAGKIQLKYNDYSKKQLADYLLDEDYSKVEIDYALDKLGY